MPFAIPPEIQAPVAQAVGWLWEKYGQPVAEKAAKRVVDETKWKFGIEKYYTSLFERVGFVRILGRMESEPLENVFTHMNVLDKLTAEQRYDVAKLKAEFDPRDFGRLERVRRIAGDDAVAEFPKLFVLGKPGAGKTTFLKHTALRAIKHEIKKVPLFVTLKELSDSGNEIVEFMTHQLRVHRFPEPEAFLTRLLENGDALVLFDGLDEVNLEDDKRAMMIQQINDFVYRYSDCPTLMTCRVAATDYSFTQFEYVEMADFDAPQMANYIELWFIGDDEKRENFKKALLENDNYKPVRELAQVPLLLALLCLVYEERNEIPPERSEIYEEAMRALLSKWDASRNIRRDDVYQQLSLGRKQKMLAQIAAKTFEQGDYFLKEKEVVQLIETYLQGIPGLEEPNAELVLRSLEAQHGIFVERARGVHSFSHLTLQEYFTARYIVDNESRGTVQRLMAHVGDGRWREVFLLVAGMLDDATKFGELYLAATYDLLLDDEANLTLINWATQKVAAMQAGYKPAASRAFLQYLVISQTSNRDQNHNRKILLDFDHALDFVRARANERTDDLAHDRARELARDLALNCDLDRDLKLALTLDYNVDYARARDYALHISLELVDTLNREPDYARARDLAQELARAIDFDLTYAFLLDVNHLRNIRRVRDDAKYLAQRLSQVVDFDLDHAQVRARDLARDLAQALARVNVFILEISMEIAEKLDLLYMQAALQKLEISTRNLNLRMARGIYKQILAVVELFRNQWDPNQMMDISQADLTHWADLLDGRYKLWEQYLETNQLLVRCLRVAYVPNRQALEDKILLPPELW